MATWMRADGSRCGGAGHWKRRRKRAVDGCQSYLGVGGGRLKAQTWKVVKMKDK